MTTYASFTPVAPLKKPDPLTMATDYNYGRSWLLPYVAQPPSQTAATPVEQPKPIGSQQQTIVTPAGDSSEDWSAARKLSIANTAVGLGLGAARIGATFIKTPQDLEAEKQLARLQVLDKGGAVQTTQMKAIEQAGQGARAGVATAARQAKQEAEGRLAARGGSLSAADQRSIEAHAQREQGQGMSEVAMREADMRLAEISRQQQERDALIAYQSARKKAKIEAVIGEVGALAAPVGQAMAANRVQQIDWTALKAANPNLTAADQMAIIKMAQMA